MIVTIITTTYNKFNHVFETIASVLQQDYPNIQYIIADDASTCFPHEEIRNFIEKNKKNNLISYDLIINEHNQGTVRNLNEALRHAIGDIVCNLAGDDVFLHPSVISEIVERFCKINCQCLITRRVVCDVNLKPISFAPQLLSNVKRLNSHKKKYEALITGMHYNTFSGSVFAIKYDELKKLCFYDKQYHLLEDKPLFEKILWNSDIALCLDIYSIKYRLGGVSDKGSHNHMLQQDDLFFRKNIEKHIKDLSLSGRRMLKLIDAHVTEHNTLKAILMYPDACFRKMIYKIKRSLYAIYDSYIIKKNMNKYTSFPVMSPKNASN